MNRLLITLMASLLLLTPRAAAQQAYGETSARYRPGKLSLVAKSHSTPTGPHEEWVDLGSDPVRARVTYTGTTRPTSEAKERLINLYMASIARAEAAKKFSTEMLFIEDGAEFWLPVQDVLIPHFRQELLKGDNVIVLADWIGITYPEKGRERAHVFLVNEFEKPESSRAAQLEAAPWETLAGPKGDFKIDFPIKPKYEEFSDGNSTGRVSSVARRYYARTDTLMLSVSYQDLGYAPGSRVVNVLPSTYERKVRESAKKAGWRVIGIRRLSDSVAEVEEWERPGGVEGYVHSISRTTVHNGHVYDLNCASLFTGQEVDRSVCRRFFNSFRLISSPR